MDGLLARIELVGGECDRCDYLVELADDGTATYTSSRGGTIVTYDAEVLRELLTVVELTSLVTGETNCGREVDGNAEVLTIPQVRLDLCFYEIDPTHPLISFIRQQRDVLEQRRNAELMTITPIGTLRYHGGLCLYGLCEITHEFFADGTWSITEDGKETTGTYDPAPLLAAIDAAEWGSGSLGPFTGECPTAYDGSEVFYAALDPGSLDTKIELASCADDIDQSNPVVMALEDQASATE